MVALLAVGCAKHAEVVDDLPSATAEGLMSCVRATLTRSDFIGRWSESASAPALYVLDAVGSLTRTDDAGRVHVGRWQFVDWSAAPVLDLDVRVAEAPCVLWIDFEDKRYSPSPEVFVPLLVGAQYADLVPVTGNEVLRWHRMPAER
ncbi:hypothetical protein ACN27E_13895 [Mycobacterium sp. WMMD1722]|uniref:hypothetical protein n=1 Tax=Mycobacterium sp. WMMD1722 TaxID=3404117 RepID=UPI003BF51981